MTVVGGAFNSPAIAARLTTRRSTATGQATDGLGFRCSTPLAQGARTAQLALQALDLVPAPHSSEAHPSSAASLARWTSEAGGAPTPAYRAITGFDKLVFIPVPTDEDVTDGTPIGLLQTSLPLTAPMLEPGTYELIWHTGDVLHIQDANGDLVCELECEDLGAHSKAGADSPSAQAPHRRAEST